MTFNYRAGLFWLVLSVFLAIAAAWTKLPLGVVVGILLGLGVASWAVALALRRSGATQRPPSGFFDVDELRLELASTQTEDPDVYRKEIEPLLDLLKARHGRHVPLSEMSRIQELITSKLAEIRHQKQAIIDRGAAEGKTIQVDALRRNIEKRKAPYQGRDREGYARGLDEFLETLTAKYGNSIPVDEAYAILQELEEGIEGPSPDDAILDWGAEPGFHERGLRLRQNNPFFAPERRKVSRQELHSAKRMDEEMLRLFENSVGVLIAALRGSQEIPPGKAVGLLEKMDELADNGSGLGPRAKPLLGALLAACDALEKVIEENADERSREGLRHSRNVLRTLSQLERHQAYIDVFRAEPAERLPTLLSCSVSDLDLLFQELPPDLAEVSKGWQRSKEELRAFAIRLMSESPEARAKLPLEPDKLEWLGIVAPASR